MTVAAVGQRHWELRHTFRSTFSLMKTVRYWCLKSLTTVKHFFMVDGAEMGDIEFAARKLGCGGLAGAISLLFTHPFDVLRRKMQ